MQSSTLTWHRTDDGVAHYTTPRAFTIERLDNGYFRVFHYGPGLTSLHTSVTDAFHHCMAAYRRAQS